MILLIQVNQNYRPVQISETQEPFTELRETLRGLCDPFRAERIVCDREARVMMDVHVLRLRSQEIVSVLGEDRLTREEMFDGVPLVIAE